MCGFEEEIELGSEDMMILEEAFERLYTSDQGFCDWFEIEFRLKITPDISCFQKFKNTHWQAYLEALHEDISRKN